MIILMRMINRLFWGASPGLEKEVGDIITTVYHNKPTD